MANADETNLNPAYWLDQIRPRPHARSFESVPEVLKTEKFCLAAVRQKGNHLQYVPKELKTEAVCMAAVQQNGAVLEFVPVNLRAKVEAALNQRTELKGT
jgi:replicative superfamily II helicase